MSSFKLELGSPACSDLCQHSSCWPSFSPAPRSRGLQNPRLKRLLEAQTELSESDAPNKLHLSEQSLPTLKILGSYPRSKLYNLNINLLPYMVIPPQTLAR